MSHAATSPLSATSGPVRVWDIWVRLFHWLLVACISTAALTGFVLGAPWLALHLASGLAAAALVIARVIWGFFGPTHARFRDFLRPPSEILSHLGGGRASRHLGHNPVGGLMMLALMALILLLGATGLTGLGGVLRTGPLAALPYAPADAALEVHEVLGWVLLAMILGHVAAAIIESRRSRENLVRSMVTGIKQRRPGDHASRAARARPRIALLLIALLAAVVALTLPRSSQAPTGAPVAERDAIFAEECTACHLAYHPSLLSAEEWRGIMGRLDDHYGEDASLDPATTRQITDWLVAHDASTVQSRPARLFAGSLLAPTGSLTDSRAWKHLHEDVQEDRFLRAPIHSKANCAACHGDAETGWFSPFRIKIPKETSQ